MIENRSGEESRKEALKQQLLDVIDYIKRANENIISVNAPGGSIIHDGYGLKGMRLKIGEIIGAEENDSLIGNEDFGGQKEQIVKLLSEIASQNPSTTGYNSDLINRNVAELIQLIG